MVQIILAAIVGLAVGSFLSHLFKEPYECQGLITLPDPIPDQPGPKVNADD